MPSPSRAIQQLVELQNQGSESFQSPPNAIDKRRPDNSSASSGVPWWNVRERMRQASRLAKAETASFNHQLENDCEVERHRDDVRAQTARYDIENQRIVVDQVVLDRTKLALIKSGQNTSILVVDAAEMVGLYGDRKVQRIDSWHDPDIKGLTQSVTRAIVDHTLTNLQISAIGMRFSSTANGKQEGQ